MNSLLHEDLRLITLALKQPVTWLLALAGILWAYLLNGGAAGTLALLGSLVVLLAIIAMADAATQLLPLLPIFLIACLGLALHPFNPPWWGPLSGMLLAGGGLLGLGLLTNALSGQASLGGGDIYLAGALGAWLTPMGLLPWLSTVAGLGVLTLLYRGARRQRGRFAFAPILCAAGWLALLHGELYYSFILP